MIPTCCQRRHQVGPELTWKTRTQGGVGPSRLSPDASAAASGSSGCQSGREGRNAHGRPQRQSASQRSSGPPATRSHRSGRAHCGHSENEHEAVNQTSLGSERHASRFAVTPGRGRIALPPCGEAGWRAVRTRMTTLDALITVADVRPKVQMDAVGHVEFPATEYTLKALAARPSRRFDLPC